LAVPDWLVEAVAAAVARYRERVVELEAAADAGVDELALMLRARRVSPQRSPVSGAAVGPVRGQRRLW
jgi:N-acyl-D-aspartate/D-glutamate deacylase